MSSVTSYILLCTQFRISKIRKSKYSMQMPKLEQYLELCSGAFDFKELFLEDDESLKVIQVSDA